MTQVALDPSGGFKLTIPSKIGKAHSVIIPFSMDGLKLLRRTLLARQREIKSTIGMNGSPTQEMCNQWLAAKAAADKATAAVEVKTELAKIEEKYGISLDELELDF